MDIARNYGAECSPVAPYMPTVTERLTNQKKDLESRLAEVNQALDALNKNPELQHLFDLISKVRY